MAHLHLMNRILSTSCSELNLISAFKRAAQQLLLLSELDQSQWHQFRAARFTSLWDIHLLSGTEYLVSAYFRFHSNGLVEGFSSCEMSWRTISSHQRLRTVELELSHAWSRTLNAEIVRIWHLPSSTETGLWSHVGIELSKFWRQRENLKWSISYSTIRELQKFLRHSLGCNSGVRPKRF